MNIDEWLKNNNACRGAMRFIDKHGWWQALYTAATDRDDWWRWLLVNLSNVKRAGLLVKRRLRAENVRLIQMHQKAGSLSAEAAVRLKIHPVPPPRHTYPWQYREAGLEDILMAMRWYARPDSHGYENHFNWWDDRVDRHVTLGRVVTFPQRVDLWRKMFPRPVMERLLELNGIEVPE